MRCGYENQGSKGQASRLPEGCRWRLEPGARTARIALLLAVALWLAFPAAGEEAGEVHRAEEAPEAGEAQDPGEAQEIVEVRNPEPAEAAATLGRLDRFNMRTSAFNYWVNQHAVRPLAGFYNALIPKLGQRGVENVLINADRPRDILNSLLQAKGERAGRHLASLLLNTTLGIGGLFYVSGHFLDDAPPETFSETLGVWGVPTGPYIVLPFIIVTDTSPRGIVGTAVDGTMHPLFWVGYTTNAIGGGTMLAVGASVRTAGGLNTVATLMPSFWTGSRSEWDAFEELWTQQTPYLEKKQLYYDNQLMDVEY